MRKSETTTGGPRIHPSVLEYEAACSPFADDSPEEAALEDGAALELHLKEATSQ